MDLDTQHFEGSLRT